MEHNDIIRCDPKCYGYTRFDTILVQTSNGPRPARLHLIFETVAYKKVWQLARVTYFTMIETTVHDRTIGMAKYEEECNGEFIFLNSIIRSCYMTPVGSSQNIFYLNNLVCGDTDIFI